MNFVEFFAGVGLVREGLSADRWNCVYATDICELKIETYSENFGSDHAHIEDIWNIAKVPDSIPNNSFLYTASFPCTDMSDAGERKGLDGEQSGTLHAFFNILEQKVNAGHGPKVVMLENVKGFLTSKSGADIATTVECLNRLGYIVDIIELDARNFTPQSRPRVFLIAIERELALAGTRIKESIDPLSEWWIEFVRNKELRSDTVKEIILNNENLNWCLTNTSPPTESDTVLDDVIETDLDEDSDLWWNDDRKEKLYSQMSKNHQMKLQIWLNRPKYCYGTVYRRMRKGKSMAELRSDGIAGCLRTPKGGSSKQILIRAGKGDWKVRLLTPREYARLQGVRDDFILPENANRGYFAMGDAVCVPAIEHISEQVLTPLYKTHLRLMGQVATRCT